MQKALSRTFKALLLMACLADSVRAQDGALTGKPCVIDKLPNGRPEDAAVIINLANYSYPSETLKGTCYYDTKGGVSYWIVRWWYDASGEPVRHDRYGTPYNEFVGYPFALKEQKRYNHEIVNTMGGATFFGPPYGKCSNGDTDFPPIRNGACWEHKRLKGPLRNADRLNQWRMNVPRSIPETGELDADTLRIPLFTTGVALLYAQAMFRNYCFGADLDYDAWTRAHAGPVSAQKTGEGQGDEISFCDPEKKRPKNRMLAGYQIIMQAIGAQLYAAQSAAGRYDKLIDQYYTPVKPETPPAGLADQLAALQASMEAHLRKAKELDQLAQQYEKNFPEFFAVSPNIR